MTSIAFIGFGAVAVHFCRIVANRNLDLKVTGVADSNGGLVADSLDLKDLIAHKENGEPVRTFQPTEAQIVRFNTAKEVAQNATYDVLIDASPTDLVTGNPGKDCALIALSRGLKVVFANKAPLVLAWDALKQYKGKFRYSATVCGGLPVVNVCTRDLTFAKFTKIQGIFNSTSNYILTEIAKGNSAEQALKEAQIRGIAEGMYSFNSLLAFCLTIC